MRFVTSGFAFVVASMIAQSPLASAAPAAKDPCNEVQKTCETAGFIQGGGKDGKGLWFDCITPIMTGTPQPKTSKKRLPHVGPKLIAACKAQNPGFGMPTPPPAQAPAAPAAPMGPGPAAPANPAPHK